MSLESWLRNGWLLSHRCKRGAVTDGEALEMVQTARELRRRVEAWLRSKHPDLLA